MFIDSHCHLDRLDLKAYDGCLPSALQGARDKGDRKSTRLNSSH